MQQLIIFKACMTLLTWSHWWIQGGSHRVPVTSPPFFPFSVAWNKKPEYRYNNFTGHREGNSCYRFPVNFEKIIVLLNLSLFSSRPLLRGHVCAGTITLRTRIRFSERRRNEQLQSRFSKLFPSAATRQLVKLF